MDVTAELFKTDGDQFTVKATASKDGRVTVSARLILERCDSGDPDRIGTDDLARRKIKQEFEKYYGNPADYPAEVAV